MWSKLNSEIVTSRIKVVEKYKAEKSTVSQTDFCAQNNITITQLREWQCMYNKQIKRFVPVTVVEEENRQIPEKNGAEAHCVLEYGEARIRFISEASLSQLLEILRVMNASHV